MHQQSLQKWLHPHTFGQDLAQPGERRTRVVIAITAVMMVAEIVGGWIFGSMALLADGLHMASHASALTISALAYAYTRRHAHDRRFTFGTGKVNSLAAFASAVLLVIFAIIMAWESTRRFLAPVPIEFNYAIAVAVLGLGVNGACMLILHLRPGEHEHHHHEHDDHKEHHHEHGHDHNLWSAYLHVFADAVTSLLAIFALLGAKYTHQNWLDPLMGIVGAVLVTRWSVSLLLASGRVLLDWAAPPELQDAIRSAIESHSDARVSDLHVWSIGPGIYAAEIAVVDSHPLPPEQYAAKASRDLPLVHVTVQVQTCK